MAVKARPIPCERASGVMACDAAPPWASAVSTEEKQSRNSAIAEQTATVHLTGIRRNMISSTIRAPLTDQKDRASTLDKGSVTVGEAMASVHRCRVGPSLSPGDRPVPK